MAVGRAWWGLLCSQGCGMTQGHFRVLLKQPMFITCNKATASTPSCAVAAGTVSSGCPSPGRELRVIREGSREQPKPAARVLHKHGPFPHTMGKRPWKQRARVPRGLFGCGCSALCSKYGGSGSTRCHHHSQRVTLRGQDDLGWQG